MRNQRYPLTELGILNLTRRLVEVGEHDKNYGECEVKFYEGAKINKRVCTCIEVAHPVARRNFLFHLARIFVDKELNVPIRYEAYDWPKDTRHDGAVDGRVHLPEPEAQQRLHRHGFRRPQSGLQVPPRWLSRRVTVE